MLNNALSRQTASLIHSGQLELEVYPDLSFRLRRQLPATDGTPGGNLPGDGAGFPLASGAARFVQAGQILEVEPLVRSDRGPASPPEQAISAQTGALGAATNWQAVAEYQTVQGGRLRVELEIVAFAGRPDGLQLQWTLTNLSAPTSQPLVLERVACPELRLGPDLVGGDALWTLQGPAVEWGQDFAFPLPETFERLNELGHRDNGEGGGIPLVYAWSRRAGLALAHIEPEQALWRMPVRSDPQEGVSLALEAERPLELAPGQVWRSLRAWVSVHQGDFYAPLQRYAELLAAQGLRPVQYAAADYEPAWCSWGYEFDVRPEQVSGALPVIQELGLRWVTLDDRWFDCFGDWNPRPDTFPGGVGQMRRLVDEIHAAGLLAQVWWYPLCVEDGAGRWDKHIFSTSALLRDHPDWLVLNPDGLPARNNRGLAILCPAVAGVQAHTLETVRRFIQDWDFDGHKLDNIYTIPPCHNPTHHHTDPDESLRAFAALYQGILETTRALKPEAVVQICPCGTTLTHTLLPCLTQAVTADPTSSAQVRQRIKFYKALLGPHAAVFADHVELTDGGLDFASAIGAGGVPGGKFVWPEAPGLREQLEEWWGLDEVRRQAYSRWLRFYQDFPLARGEALNLYDLAFDIPETYVTRLDSRLYYAFFTPDLKQHFRGAVTLRGLSAAQYKLRELPGGRPLGKLRGPDAELELDFHGSFLIEATPLK